MGDKSLSESEYLAKARKVVDSIHRKIPGGIQAEKSEDVSKLPFKIYGVRESLAHRAVELGDVAVGLFEAHKTMAAFVITRSVIETAAIMYRLHQELEKLYKDQNFLGFDNFITKLLFGCRNKMLPEESVNILTQIKHLDSFLDGTNDAYEFLSEFAHPNYSGVHGSYATLAEDNLTLNFSGSDKMSKRMGLPYLVVYLEVFNKFYLESLETVKKIDEMYKESEEI